MMKGRSHVLPILSAGLVAFLTGCGLGMLPTPDVDLPSTVQFVLDNAQGFRSAEDDPLQTIDPGTVIDDLADLSGCWATMFTDAEIDVGAAFFVVYRFDPEDGSVTRWSFVGLQTGRLFPLAPVITAEHGTYEITGENTLLLSIERLESNVNEAGQVTGTLGPTAPFAVPYERPALVTLSGDSMLLYIDIATADDADEEAERPIFQQFDCPTED